MKKNRFFLISISLVLLVFSKTINSTVEQLASALQNLGEEVEIDRRFQQIRQAIKDNNLKPIKTFLKEGGQVDAPVGGSRGDPKSNTMLSVAVRNKQKEIVQFLLGKGANPNYSDTLYRASMPPNLEILMILAKSKQLTLHEDLLFFLIFTFDKKSFYENENKQAQYKELFEELIKRSTNIDIPVKYTTTMFGLDPKPDPKERTAFYYAASSTVPEILEQFKGKADINKHNYFGDTPLHTTARYGMIENFIQLIIMGADDSIKNNKGKTCFDVAEEEVKETGRKILEIRLRGLRRKKFALEEEELMEQTKKRIEELEAQINKIESKYKLAAQLAKTQGKEQGKTYKEILKTIETSPRLKKK